MSAPPSDFTRRLAALRGKAIDESGVRVRPVGESTAEIHRFETNLVGQAEAELCDRLRVQMESQGFDVWFEVPMGGGRPDVAGIRGDETIGIEAKRRDIPGVIKQGLRMARYVDRAYVALPLKTYQEAVNLLDRLTRRNDEYGRDDAIPGVIVVGPAEVKVVRHPRGSPRRRIPADTLRRIADLLGEERGGVPGGDRTERNLAIWRSWAGGMPVGLVARRRNLDPDTIARVIRRIVLEREHLAWCSAGPCQGADWVEVEFAKHAHRHREDLLALPLRDLDDLDG